MNDLGILRSEFQVIVPMRVDRILIDVLDWIGRVLSWKQDKQAAIKPYDVLKQYRGKQGILKLVARDTPRAVRTYIFSPFPDGETNRKQPKRDLHICLDHLQDDVPSRRQANHSRQKARRRLGNSHRISIFEASRFLSKDGTYHTMQIYTADFNLLGNGLYRDQFAIPIVDDLAMLMKEFPVDTIDWQVEVESGCKHHMGTHWRPMQPLEKDA